MDSEAREFEKRKAEATLRQAISRIDEYAKRLKELEGVCNKLLEFKRKALYKTIIRILTCFTIVVIIWTFFRWDADEFRFWIEISCMIGAVTGILHTRFKRFQGVQNQIKECKEEIESSFKDTSHNLIFIEHGREL